VKTMSAGGLSPWKQRLSTATLDDPAKHLEKMRASRQMSGLPNMSNAARSVTEHTNSLPPTSSGMGNGMRPQGGPPAPISAAPLGSTTMQAERRSTSMGAQEVVSRQPPMGSQGPDRGIHSIYDAQPRTWASIPGQTNVQNVMLDELPSGTIRPQATSRLDDGTPRDGPSGQDLSVVPPSNSSAGPSGVATSAQGLIPGSVGTSAQGLASSGPSGSASTTPQEPSNASSETSSEPDYNQPSDAIGDLASSGFFHSSGQTAQDYADSFGVDAGFVQSLLDDGLYLDDDGYVFRRVERDNGFAEFEEVGDIEDIPDGDVGIMSSRYKRWQEEQAQKQQNDANALAERNRQKAVDTLMSGIDRVDQIEGLDPALLTDVLRSQRTARDQAISRARREAMQSAGVAGLGGAAAQGYASEASLPAEIQGASQDAQAKLQFGLQNMQLQLQQTDRALASLSQIASIYAGTAQADQALAAQRSLMQYKTRLEQEMATYMQRFQPTWLEQGLGMFLGAGANALGTFTGTYAAKD
jgi:hypothetical protein